MKKNGTTGQISESVVLIAFAHGRSSRKSGTDSGTNLVDRHRNQIRFQFRRLSPPEKTSSEITAVISCRKSLSRTPVPNLDPGKRCLYWMSRSPGLCGIRQRFCTHGKKALPPCRATGPVSGWVRRGGAQTHSQGRNHPQSPHRAPCAVRIRRGAVRIGRSAVGNGRRGQKEEKLRFFSPIPADFRRIYFKAGISAAVTSARNSGQGRRKTALLRGFRGSDK